MIKLIVFLGNPGKEYVNSRHNAGFILSSFLYPNVSWQSKFHSFYGLDSNLKLLKPLTMMNLSGNAVGECSAFFKIKAEEILVVCDDMELAFGEAKLQRGGGTKGHKGLRNIQERLKTEDFYRLRIGIGRPKHQDVRLFVTSPFTKDEEITLSNLFSLIKKDWPLAEKEKEWKVE